MRFELDADQRDFAASLDSLLAASDAASVARAWADGYLFSLSGPIYAGTNEVQRNVIAERILGLPREARS